MAEMGPGFAPGRRQVGFVFSVSPCLRVENRPTAAIRAGFAPERPFQLAAVAVAGIVIGGDGGR